MKAKNILLALGTVAMATSAYAYTETVETMTVELNSGKTVVYNVNEINKVSFGSHDETIGFLITGADGNELYRAENIATLFRYAPEADGANVQLLFGTAENATEVVGLKDGQYFVDVEMTNAGLYKENINLAGDVTSAKVRLYEVTDGEISAPKEVVTEGTLSTSITAKGVVTMELDATFDDGFAVRASYKGSPADVDDLEALFPTPGPKNEVWYYNLDGELTNKTAIPRFKKTHSNYTGRSKYAVQFDDDHWSMKCEIEMKPELIGKEINFAAAEDNAGSPDFTFRYEGIQVAGPNGESRPRGLTGTMQVIENGDGTITVKANVTNLYYNPVTSGNGGTPERAVINFTGECSGL